MTGEAHSHAPVTSDRVPSIRLGLGAVGERVFLKRLQTLKPSYSPLPLPFSITFHLLRSDGDARQTPYSALRG
jgi:hypothetical protein